MNQQTIIPPSTQSFLYASFTARTIAMLIDVMIVFALMLIIFLPLFLVSIFASLILMPLLALLNLTIVPSLFFFWAMISWVYFATMESGARGATYGKRLMGLRAVGEKGDQLTFARASVRYFAKIVSAIPMFLGFFMAIVTQRKQALHDLIAETLIIKVR